jgi:methyl-accepting chemotaxis protein
MFRNLKMYVKMMILIGVAAAALTINCVIGFSGFATSLSGIDQIYYGSVQDIKILNQIKNLINIDLIISVQKLRDKTISWDEGQDFLKDINTKLDVAWNEYQKVFESHSDNLMDRSGMNQLQLAIKANKPLLKLQEIVRNQNLEALNQFAINELFPYAEPIDKEVDQAIERVVLETQSDYKEVKSSISVDKDILLVVFFVAMVIFILLSTMIALSIIKPLKRTVEIVNQIAKGDNSVEIENPSKDEVGRLQFAMKEMITSNMKMTGAVAAFSTGDLDVVVIPRSEKDLLAITLNNMIESSRKMIDLLTSIANGDLSVNIQKRSDKDTLGIAFITMAANLRNIIGNIQTEVTGLTSSAQEIVASVAQVSAGTAETAAAVTETTTTVEELKQTAQLSADKAKDVLTSAEDTMKVVRNSEKLLQETQQDMDKINEKMRIISEGIVKLSESSQTIGEIIDTVNDLAEQSNLLAVNAAIEAAKAGEQGKSFAVVAQEIRILAEQSKASTVQVRSILNEIQNATSAAVLATEQGLKAVEKGVVQSSQTSDSMVILSSSISRVTQSANQIAISSQQQLVGVDQVTVAMNNINEASNQHVDHMKQIETAISGLNDVSMALKDITNQYVLPESHDKRNNLNEIEGKLDVINKNKMKQKFLGESYVQ